MAPEVIDDSIQKQNFDAYKQADIYSMGLVLWEIVRRCVTHGMKQIFFLFYHSSLQTEITVYYVYIDRIEKDVLKAMNYILLDCCIVCSGFRLCMIDV